MAKRSEDERQEFLAREQLARRQAETANEQLRESEEKYRALFDSIDEGFCVIEVLFDDRDHAVTTAFWKSIGPLRSKPASRTPLDAGCARSCRRTRSTGSRFTGRLR